MSVALIGLGILGVLVSRLMRSREQKKLLAQLLGLAEPAGDEHDEPAVSSPLVERVVALAANVADRRGSLAERLERARLPLRPGEYVVLRVAGGLVAAAVLLGTTRQPILAVAGFGGASMLMNLVVRRRISKRRKTFESHLPAALSLVASSLAAGHTFLRAIQMMCEESDPVLAEEFSRVVAETRLGDPLVEALDRMAQRVQIRDVAWVVQAIRIQQTVGGRLADLLHTLADYIRAREEVRREVQVLTAEGRMSAWVLGALAPFLVVMTQVLNPGYMQPMFRGWGLVVLGLAGASIALGMFVILRMVRLDV